MNEDSAQAVSDAPMRVEPLQYAPTSRQNDVSVWRLLAYVGIGVGAVRVILGLLILWTLGVFGTNPVSAGTQATISARTYTGLEFGQIVVGVALCIASVAVLRGRGSGAIAMRWIEIAYCFFMLCALAVNAYGFHQSAASRPSYYTGVLIYTAGRYAATTLTQCAYSIVVIGLRRDDLIERQ